MFSEGIGTVVAKQDSTNHRNNRVAARGYGTVDVVRMQFVVAPA